MTGRGPKTKYGEKMKTYPIRLTEKQRSAILLDGMLDKVRAFLDKAAKKQQ